MALKVYGPYTRKDNRQHIILYDTETKIRRTQSYPRYLMEQHLGRELSPVEHVDHINNNPSDNRIENLQLLSQLENNRKSNLGKTSPLRGIEKGFTHGSIYGWKNKKCTCDKCLIAKRKWNNKRNADSRVARDNSKDNL